MRVARNKSVSLQIASATRNQAQSVNPTGEKPIGTSSGRRQQHRYRIVNGDNQVGYYGNRRSNLPATLASDDADVHQPHTEEVVCPLNRYLEMMRTV